MITIKKMYENFEKFLLDNGFISAESLIDSLENWDKKSITFNRAVECVQEMISLIVEHEKQIFWD